MHAEFAQAQCQQQADEADVAGHFAAHGHRFACRDTGFYGGADQPKHGRIQRVVEIIDLIVDPVDRHRVLDQVVGADREKIQTAGENVGADRCRRDLDHATDLHLAIERHRLGRELTLDLGDHLQYLLQFVEDRQHGDHQPDRAQCRGADDGPQLRPEQRGVLQAQPDRAQT